MPDVKDQLVEAVNGLKSFDDLSVYAAMDMINPDINTALVVSEGSRKTDQRLYMWDGTRYKEAGAAGLEREIIRSVTTLKERYVADLLAITGSDKESEKDRDAIRDKIKSISAFLNTQRRRGLEATIRTLKMMDAGEAGMDADQTKINLQNGVYDLVKHELVPHDPCQRFTRITNFAYNPEAKAPMFTKHLEYVLPDEMTRQYLLEVLASALLRSRREELVFFLWGRTAGNGKSELMRMIITALGEYGTWMDPHTFTTKRAQNSTQPEMLLAIGKSIAAVDEPAKDDMDTSAFKNTANMADMVLRGLYQASKIERWTATCVMLCNNLPPLDARDAGAARRPVVIPFSTQITEDMKAKDERPAGYATMRYGEYVGKVEAAGIFNVLVEALKRHQARNCLLPKMSTEMRTATDEYIYQNNAVARFVALCYERAPGEVVNAKNFHDAFKTFCHEVLGYDSKYIMKIDSIKDAMGGLGYEYKVVCDKRTDDKTTRCYINIKTKQHVDDAPDNLRRDISMYLRLCHPLQQSTTEKIKEHFSQVEAKTLEATLRKMSMIGEVLHNPDDSWGYVEP